MNSAEYILQIRSIINSLINVYEIPENKIIFLHKERISVCKFVIYYALFV